MNPVLLDGTWQLVRAELDGERAPEMVATKTEITLRGGNYEVRFGGVTADRGTFEVGLTLEVSALVLHGTEGPNAGRTIPCIFQLAGERLRVCYGLNGVAPTEFVTAAGQQRYLAVYRRIGPAI